MPGETTTGNPAALLVAVLVLAVNSIGQYGAWNFQDTVIGSLVSIIVVATTHQALSTTPWPEQFATGLTYASCLTIALSYFAQFGVRHFYHPIGGNKTEIDDRVADVSTAVAFGMAALFTAIGVYRYKRNRLGRNGKNG